MVERTTPTLTAKGWLNNEDVAERIDAVMSYAWTADNAQSTTFAGNITSIQWIISKHSGKNAIALQTELQDTLDGYLKKHFDSVDLTIDVEENGSQMDIVMEGSITNDGKTAGIQYLLTARNSTIEKVTNALNGEVVYG